MDEAKLESRLAVVENTINFIAKDITDIKDNHLKHIYEKIDCIAKKLATPKLPLWASVLITILSSLVTGLIVASIKFKGG